MQWRDCAGREAAEIAALVQVDEKSVVEVGCGTGRLTAFLAERARFLYAFDPEAGSVAQASESLSRELRDRVQFAVHDAQALDVPRRRFDLAVCGWSL